MFRFDKKKTFRVMENAANNLTLKFSFTHFESKSVAYR